MSMISNRINRHYSDQNWSLWAKLSIYEGIDKIPEICSIDKMRPICHVGHYITMCQPIPLGLLDVYLNTYI